MTTEVNGTVRYDARYITLFNMDTLKFGTWPVGSTSNVPHAIGTGTGGGSLTGDNPADFPGGTACPATAGGCLLSTNFSPSATGIRSALLDLYGVTSSGYDALFALQGAGGSGANLLFYGPSNPNVLIGSSIVTAPTAHNTGSTTLVLASCSITGPNAADFSFNGAACPQTLAPGAHFNFNLNFAPSVPGVRSATVSFTDATSLQTFNLPVSGFASFAAVTPNVSTYTLPRTSINATSQAATFTVTRSLTHPITAALASGANFYLGKSTCAQDENPCTLTAYFKPTTSAPSGSTYLTDTLNVTDYIASSTAPITLFGQPGTAVVSTNPTSLSFISRPVGTISIAQTITVSNTGTTSAMISSIVLSGTNAQEFSQTNNCSATLAAGASCTINVTFAPTVSGSKVASIVISGDSNLPLSVGITGSAQ